jgi:hypothetical protein
MESDTQTSAKLPMIDDLGSDDLRALRVRIDVLLAERDAQAKREATARIRALAREAGLSVSIDPHARKRGRPRKSETAAT